MAFSDRPSPGGSLGPAPQRPHPGKHAKGHHSPWLLVVPGAAVLAVLVGLAVFLTRQSAQPLVPTTKPAAHASRVHAVPASAVDRAVAACRRAWVAQSPALQAADRSLAQWQTHVQAMNALVEGRISLAQATKFWARTRVGAKHRVRRFERAYALLQQDPPSCAAPDPPVGAGAPAATLRACARGFRIRNTTLSTAQRAIRTWQGHIREMEMLRNGRLSPTTATQMWITMWHRGQHQLDDYHSVASRAAAQHC